MNMKNIRCYDRFVIKEYFQRENDIFFLTDEGVELKYVGKYSMNELKFRLRLCQPTLLGISPDGKLCALQEDVIFSQLR